MKYWIAYKSTDPVFEGTIIIDLNHSIFLKTGFDLAELWLHSVFNNQTIVITAWDNYAAWDERRTNKIQQIAEALYTLWGSTLADTIVLESNTDLHGFRYLPHEACDELLKQLCLRFDQVPDKLKEEFMKHAEDIVKVIL